ncbi:MAG: acetyltransferase [Elusimicrobiota bacterium]|jgi:sugar O-acyltransferase (sialic acid O-acetyltransferase NeuD family)
MKKIVIFGTGDVAELAHFYMTHDSERRIAAFCADGDQIQSKAFCGLPVVPFENVQKEFPADRFDLFIALSYNKLNETRARKYTEAKAKGYTLASYVSTRSVTWPDLTIGDNCFIMENQTIQPFVKIGNNVTLWSGNHVGHGAVIDDHVFVTSHVVISGHVKVGAFSFLGVNCTLKDGITLAPKTVVGAGATVLSNTQENGVYTGPKAELRARDASRIRYFTHTKYTER